MNDTVAQRIALALKRHGVTTIFGQSLPSAVILAAEALGIRQVSYRQENAGGTMADGFARISGTIAVVTAQNGPAATLLVPPLAEALKASIPVVALVQEVERPQAERNAFQELDHPALFQACAKWVRRIVTGDRIDDHVDAAFVAAGSGRPGPAVLLLPADLLREIAPVAAAPRRASLGHWPTDLIQPAAGAIRDAAAMIAESRFPVVIAGGGVHAAGGFHALARLQEAAHLPVFTTLMGKGTVDEHHPLSCGVLGPLVGPRSLGRHSRALLAEADLVLLAGTRTNQNGTDSWRLIPPGARVLHIDVDPNEIGRNYEAVRLVGSAGPTLAALCDALGTLDLRHRAATRPAVEARIAGLWQRFEADRRDVTARRPGPLRPERVMAELQYRLTPDTIVAADASYSSFWVAGQLRSLGAGMRFLTPRGLAGLGWGLPLAMGAKLARPAAPVVAVVGDGGFAHSWAELETLARSGIALTVIVLNNGILGFQKDAETVKFGAYTTACHFAPVDHAQIARACGCAAARVEDGAALPGALELALRSDRPWLLDVMTDPAAHPPLSLFDGTLDRAVD
ncbi:acetolactate synthase catalytic subunit [Azospirillum sp. RWY-5-1]|uniref:Acetolactate synthase catalytic subunit n=1 Tax=Azospirillum oleiclasticum TaxID=2735135 RepID=A0ABX2TJE5_9PROT|nr:acetolactate synthase catalytic subunit [Azospirillum oleiclasticum]NYZ14360.1 acetolactate synthase catalytic subunit [Azospirillum oleiclasticum]NYZ23288.1 acetolactate synthase catalytic subunit [Azospirillum oleiclasticum]